VTALSEGKLIEAAPCSSSFMQTEISPQICQPLKGSENSPAAFTDSRHGGASEGRQQLVLSPTQFSNHRQPCSCILDPVVTSSR